MFIFSKETKDRLDQILQTMTLSKEERYIIIEQLEVLIERDVAKILVSNSNRTIKQR